MTSTPSEVQEDDGERDADEPGDDLPSAGSYGTDPGTEEPGGFLRVRLRPTRLGSGAGRRRSVLGWPSPRPSRQVGDDVHAGRHERSGQHEPDHPEEAAGADRHDEDDERVQVEGRAEGDRLEDVLEQPVREQHDDQHDERRRRSLEPRAMMTAKAPATNAPMYGT